MKLIAYSQILRKFNLLYLLICLGSLPIHSARALLVSEDFNYPQLDTGDAILGANGGNGWGGAWQGVNNILFNKTIDLSYPDYPLEQVMGSGSIYSQTSNHRAVFRDLEVGLSGDRWFSFQFRKGGTGAGGLQFNATSGTSSGGSNPSDWNVMVDTSGSLSVAINGFATELESEVSNGLDYWILGRMVTGSAGLFEIWVNPDLTSIVSRNDFVSSIAPNFATADVINPESIESLGVSAYRGTGTSSVFRFDALRMSDGDGDSDLAFNQVTAIPEPLFVAQIMFLFCFGIVMLARRRRRIA